MPKPLELRKVIRILKKYGIIYVTGKGRHPKFYDPETHYCQVPYLKTKETQKESTSTLGLFKIECLESKFK